MLQTRDLLRYLSGGMLNFIYPPRCFFCRALMEENNGLCETCFNDIRLIESPYCVKCGMPLDPPEAFEGAEAPQCLSCRGHRKSFDTARAIGRYEGALKECIHLFKYKGKKVVLKVFERLIAAHFGQMMPSGKISFIAPVPLHKKKLKEREFNQSELIAEVIGMGFGIPVVTDILSRTVYTKPQVKLNREERAKNVRGVFAARECGWLTKSSVLLVDDVFTTGATINECARVLKAGGAEEVYAFTIAHDV